MPIYEFRCKGCNRRTSLFVRTVTSPVRGACEHCGGADLDRLISRVAVMRSGDMPSLDDGALAGLDENDPRAMAKWVRKMSREMGQPLDADMQSELERMEAGQLPDDDFADDGDLGED